MKKLLPILTIAILLSGCQKDCKDNPNLGEICIGNSTLTEISVMVGDYTFPLQPGAIECYDFDPGEYEVEGVELIGGAIGPSLTTKLVNVKACKTRDVTF